MIIAFDRFDGSYTSEVSIKERRWNVNQPIALDSPRTLFCSKQRVAYIKLRENEWILNNLNGYGRSQISSSLSSRSFIYCSHYSCSTKNNVSEGFLRINYEYNYFVLQYLRKYRSRYFCAKHFINNTTEWYRSSIGKDVFVSFFTIFCTAIICRTDSRKEKVNNGPSLKSTWPKIK